MKKAINNKMYDTSTAKRLALYDNGLSYSDFGYFSETLYIKKTGEYFLHGEGGGNSRYGEWHGNNGGPGEKIMPLTPDEARAWAQEHLEGDEYEGIFGNPEPEEGRVTLNLTVLPGTKVKLEKLREQTGKSISRLIEEMVE